MSKEINWENIEKLEADYLKISLKIEKLKASRRSIITLANKELCKSKQENCLMCAHLGFDFDEIGIVHNCSCKN